MTDRDKINLAKEVLEEQLASPEIDYNKLSTAKTILDSIFAKLWLRNNGIKS